MPVDEGDFAAHKIFIIQELARLGRGQEALIRDVHEVREDISQVKAQIAAIDAAGIRTDLSQVQKDVSALKVWGALGMAAAVALIGLIVKLLLPKVLA